MTDSAVSAPEFNDEPAVECSVPEPVLCLSSVTVTPVVSRWVNFKALDLYPGDPPIISDPESFAKSNRTLLVVHELESIEEMDNALDVTLSALNQGTHTTFVLKNTSPLAPAIVNSLNRNHPELGLCYLWVL
mgnify:CR=1 FL=1